MTSRLLISLFAALFLSAPAIGAGGGGGDASEPSNRVRAGFTLDPVYSDQPVDETTTSSENPRVIDIPTMVMPAFRNDHLENYLFVTVRLVASEGVSHWRLRERTHYMRDAMIRAAHRTSVADPNDPTRLDMEAAREVMQEGLDEVLEPGSIERVEIIGVDTRRARVN